MSVCALSKCCSVPTTWTWFHGPSGKLNICIFQLLYDWSNCTKILSSYVTTRIPGKNGFEKFETICSNRQMCTVNIFHLSDDVGSMVSSGQAIKMSFVFSVMSTLLPVPNIDRVTEKTLFLCYSNRKDIIYAVTLICRQQSCIM